MSDKTTILDTGASKILAVQSLLTAGIAWAFYVYNGLLAAQGALYGGCMVMFNVWMTNRRLQTATKIAPGNEIKIFYIAAVQRFIFTLGFFILGMGLLELPPLPMVIAFACAHFAYIKKP